MMVKAFLDFKGLDLLHCVKMLLQKCGRHPLAAESPCKSAGRFRYQRIVPAEVLEVSAVSGLLLQKCRTFPLAADAVAKLQGVSAGCGLLLHFCGRVSMFNFDLKRGLKGLLSKKVVG